MRKTSIDIDKAIVIGRFGRTFGVHGEIRVHSESMHPERWLELDHVYTMPIGTKEIEQFTIESLDLDNYNIKVKLIEINNLEDAKQLTNADVMIPETDRAKLDEGEFYLDDIIGSAVKCNETLIGRLTDVIQQGHHDLWVVKENGDEFLIPAVKEFVESVDLSNKLITVKTIEGLRSHT